MHVCASKNDLVMCKRHINSVDVNETDEKIRIPLHVAMIFGSDAMCDLLLKYGADIQAKDSFMDDPIQLAFYYGRFELLSIFHSSDNSLPEAVTRRSFVKKVF